MQTTIYTDPSGFDTLAQEWDNLLERSVHPPFFIRYSYQKTWWRYLGNGDLLLIAIRTDNGQLVGLAPLFASTDQAGQRRLALVGCVDVSDYLDLLVDRDHVDAVHQALLDCLSSSELVWDKLYLCSLPHNSITQTHLVETARMRGGRPRLINKKSVR
jgi:hypothetical protein